MNGRPASPVSAVRTAYFDRVPNVGDQVNPLLLAAITGRRAVQATDLFQPHLLAVGSLMARSTRVSQVWGTGVIDPDGGVGGVMKANVHAVRGQLSYAALRSSGVSMGDVALGDPAFLAPELLGISKAAAPSYAIGLVRHYLDRDNPMWARWKAAPGVVDLDVGAAPGVFLAQMAQCAVVISTSLHGLVFAEALGIPNLWVRAGDALIGGEFKFRDWFSTTRRPQAAPHLLQANDAPADLAAGAAIRESAIDASALRSAFPHHRLEELQSSPRPGLFGRLSSRATERVTRAVRTVRRLKPGR